MTSPIAIERVVQGLMGYGPEKIVLFGSVARGDADEFSDIDLIVVKETDQRFVQRLVDISALISSYISVDVFVYTPGEIKAMVEDGNPFIEQALKDGIVLYEKS